MVFEIFNTKTVVDICFCLSDNSYFLRFSGMLLC